MADLSGVLVLNKPAGLTSHDCVAKVRQLTRVKKVGHTGTLDPEATGVLPICIGKATKIVPYLINAQKTYRAKIRLGLATTTEDFTGEPIDEVPVKKPIDKETVLSVLNGFLGEIEQIPPLYSAVKVKGKKLYEWAREGVEVERPVRRVVIHQLTLVDYHPDPPHPVLEIEVTCSKGTYIRTLGVDIGKALGYPAHLAALVRTRSGPFTIDHSVNLETLQSWSTTDWRDRLFTLDEALRHYPVLRVDWDEALRIKQGQKLRLTEALHPRYLYRIHDPKRQLVALASAVNQSLIKPEKVF